MRILLNVFLIFIMLSCGQSKKNSKADHEYPLFSVHIDKIKVHCGGMSPPPEYKNGYLTVPFKNTKFYIKKGDKNTAEKDVLASFTTDDAGNATFRLPAGRYCIIIGEKTKEYEKFYEDNLPNSPKVEPKSDSCFEKWYHKCDASYGFTEENSNISFSIYELCSGSSNPCLNFTGEPPR